MSYAPIDIELMRSKLLTVDAVKERIAPTEGLQQYEFDTDGSERVRFDFPDGWNSNIDSMQEYDTTNASVTIAGNEIALTKNGALDTFSTIGLGKSFGSRVPGSLVTPMVNFEYNNGANGNKSLKLLAGNNGALAFIRGTVTPFSNSRLLDAVVEGVQEKYGTNDVLIDYKLNNSLDRTNLRVIVPSQYRSIGSARAAEAGSDPWSAGIEIINSSTGKGSLELVGSLFAFWCTNGCTMEHASSGKYRRKPSLTPDDAYEWARGVVDDVFNDLAHEFDVIESLTQIPLEGELTETVNRAFERFNINDDARDIIMNNLVESDDITAYGLLNSITSAANSDTLNPNTVTSLLRAGGQFATAMHTERCESCHRF